MRKYNYKKVRLHVIKIVKQACDSPSNYVTNTVWQHHIIPVVGYSLKLGKKLKADLEVLELAALLHDLAAIKNANQAAEHHRYGAELAEKILRNLRFSEGKIDLIKNCILNHRGSKPGKRDSLEEKILASADAISHFTELADMMYLAYGVHKLKTVDGAIWLKGKLERSWKKIIPEGKKMIFEDYKLAMKILDKAIMKRNQL